jgi:peptidoglycan/xylan/chitin deacetylase (PgdA/CDA1 family)
MMLRGGKEVFSRTADYIGVNRAFRAHHSRQLLVLSYHGVVSDRCAHEYGRYGNLIGVSEFSHQMAELVRQFTPISASQLRDWREGERIPQNSVLVTFDDGFRNNLTCAAPVLQRFGIPALIHLTTGYIGRQRILWPDELLWRAANWPKRFLPLPGEDGEIRTPDRVSERLALARTLRESCKRLPHDVSGRYLNQLREYDVQQPEEEAYAFLTWDEVRKLKTKGFTIGSHTIEHPILTQLEDRRMTFELRESRRVIERKIGEECLCFAYPNGGRLDISPAVVEGVRAAGYAFAFKVMGRRSSRKQDPMTLDRVYVAGASSVADFHCRISGFHQTMRRCLKR